VKYHWSFTVHGWVEQSLYLQTLGVVIGLDLEGLPLCPLPELSGQPPEGGLLNWLFAGDVHSSLKAFLAVVS
jgi:hypothetical protein